MNTKRAAQLLLILSCVMATGCASLRSSRVREPSTILDQGNEEDSHAELERELNLYSD